MNVRLQMGEAVSGLSLMKFTLTYDGELRSNKAKQKWEIRKAFAPQLEELWRVNPSLLLLAKNHHVPVTPGFSVWEVHHSVDETLSFGGAPADWVDICPTVSVGSHSFLPLVRESLALKCGLKILFLRKEEPGRIYQGGDMDNRLKTLFDALSIPNSEQLVDDPTVSHPIHCLLEDDSLISGMSVETHRLLGHPNGSKHEVRLVVEVDVRVTMARTYNQLFLGD